MKALLTIAIIALLAFLSGCTALEDADIMQGGQQSLRAPVASGGGTIAPPPKEEPTRNDCLTNPYGQRCAEYCQTNPSDPLCEHLQEPVNPCRDPNSNLCRLHCGQTPAPKECIKACGDPANFDTDMCGGLCRGNPELNICTVACRFDASNNACQQKCYSEGVAGAESGTPPSQACRNACANPIDGAEHACVAYCYANPANEICAMACEINPESTACWYRELYCYQNPTAEGC